MEKKTKILFITLILIFSLANFVSAKEMFQEQIVVLPFENETRYTDQNYEFIITSIIERELQDLNYRVITRDLEQLAEELKLSRSGIVDRAVELGKITGARKVISGRILSITESFDEDSEASVVVSIRIVDVETAEVFKTIGIIEETARGSSKENAVNQAFQKVGTSFSREMRGVTPTLYFDMSSTVDGVRAIKAGVAYQLNPHLGLIGDYRLVSKLSSKQYAISLNAKFRGFELESHDFIFSFINAYHLSKSEGNFKGDFRFGPSISMRLYDSLTLVGGGFLSVYLPEPSDEEELSNELYQLGLQYQLLKDKFGFDQINLELKFSNMLAPEDRGGDLSLGIVSYW